MVARPLSLRLSYSKRPRTSYLGPAIRLPGKSLGPPIQFPRKPRRRLSEATSAIWPSRSSRSWAALPRHAAPGSIDMSPPTRLREPQ